LLFSKRGTGTAVFFVSLQKKNLFPMNILILGSGGREHAFAWKLSQSKKPLNLFIAPGNAGTTALGTNLPIAVTDFEEIKKAVVAHAIEMVVVGPEDPLVKGIHDFFLADAKRRGATGRQQGFLETFYATSSHTDSTL
jgi:hypothetical protein